jgi:DnaJ-class molecular chaperone
MENTMDKECFLCFGKGVFLEYGKIKCCSLCNGLGIIKENKKIKTLRRGKSKKGYMRNQRLNH